MRELIFPTSPLSTGRNWSMRHDRCWMLPGNIEHGFYLDPPTVYRADINPIIVFMSSIRKDILSLATTNDSAPDSEANRLMTSVTIPPETIVLHFEFEVSFVAF